MKNFTLFALIVGLTSCNSTMLIRKETISSYLVLENGKLSLTDSTINYFNDQNNLIKQVRPAFNSRNVKKISNELLNITYDTEKRMLKKYSHDYYNSNSILYLRDSLSNVYEDGLLKKTILFPGGNRSHPKTLLFNYENGKLVSEINNDSADYISYTYPNNDTIIIKTRYINKEVCYKQYTISSNKLDTLKVLKINRNNGQCGFNSETVYHKLYNKKGNLTMVMVDDAGFSGYYYYSNSLLIKKCSEKEKSCTETYDYTFDKYGNWIIKNQFINNKIRRVDKREIEYL